MELQPNQIILHYLVQQPNTDFHSNLFFSRNIVFFFLVDYCCRTSLQRYLSVCGVVTLEEFEKFDFFKMTAIFFVAKILKSF